MKRAKRQTPKKQTQEQNAKRQKADPRAKQNAKKSKPNAGSRPLGLIFSSATARLRLTTSVLFFAGPFLACFLSFLRSWIKEGKSRCQRY